jgi:cobaltochelatase CobN
MGGLNLAVRSVTGEDPKAYFNDFRNANNPGMQTMEEAVWSEAQSTLFNPEYIRAIQQGSASSAEKLAETFRNTYGWNVMKPEAIKDELWDEVYDTYVNDKYDLGVQAFFENENPYALQEMTGVMMETARKGLWEADREIRCGLFRFCLRQHQAARLYRRAVAARTAPELRGADQEVAGGSGGGQRGFNGA